MNLKTVVRELILSPYYRAANATDVLGPDREIELQAVGTGRLSTPRLLAQKIEAATGQRWARGWDREDYLLSDYKILYGGIDSDSVTDRLTEPNGIMANVALRMANEVACAATAYDFTRDPDDRFLFPEVSVLDVPRSPAGGEVPTSIDAIKDNIRYLHAHVLGEELELGDPEIERTYRLFDETQQEGSAAVAAESLSSGITWRCRGRVDPATDEDLPEGQRVEDDDNYAVRSWMAVITYLLSDHKFLYE
jgi:hypothetical protein